MSDRVTINRRDGVADVRFNRPDKLNALDAAQVRGIAEAIDALAEDRSVRVVVLSGEGRGFCAGLDVAAFGAMAATGQQGDGSTGDDAPQATDLEARLPGKITNLYQQVAWGWHELPQPVIAAVHGVCFGGGLQIAMGADIRIAAPDSRWSVMEVRWGLLPDMSGPQLLPRHVGLDVAKELVFTGRIVSGEEADRLGLATRVDADPHAAAMALAGEIAGRNPEAVRGSKALLNATGTRPAAEGLLDETRRMVRLIGSPNQVEAVMAEMEGRAPTFRD